MSEDSLIETKSPEMSPAALPQWFDEELFERGQNYAKKDLASITMAYLYGSACALMVPSVGKVFMGTKRSTSPCLAFRRYFSSALLFYCFHMNSFKDKSSKFYKAIFTIRHMHSLASKKVSKDCGYGISQRDMALVQFTFIAFILVKPKSLRLKLKSEDKEGFNHFWRVIGHLLGIPDSINVCRKNAAETAILGEKIMSEVLKRHAESLTADSKILLSNLFKGFNDVIPLFHKDAILSLIYEAMGSKYEERMSLSTVVNYTIWKTMFLFTGIYMVGDMMRYLLGVAVHVYYYIYQRYPIIAWLKYGKAKSKLYLFKK